MNKFIQSFKNKKFKYGTYSAISAIVVIAVLIAVNLVVSQFDLKFDLTSNDMFSISDTSKEIINNLDTDVNIYALFKTGSEDATFKEILEQYASNSKHVNVIYKDPYLYPQFTQNYSSNGQEIEVNSIIVESGERYKVIMPDELISYSTNYQTYQTYAESIDIEPKVTSAIQYVTTENIPVVYYMTGHNEMPIPPYFEQQLEASNYQIQEINLLTMETIPSDCSALIMTTPGRDYTIEETKKIKDYLANDGRAILLLQYTSSNLPNVNSILNSYGVQIDKSVIVEGNKENYYQNPTWLLPNIESHDMTKNTLDKNYRIFLPIGQTITETELKKNSLTIEPLLTTSKKSYSKNNPQAQSVNKEQGDMEGPFNVGVAITDSYYTDVAHQTKMIVVSSSDMLLDEISGYVSGGNTSFILSAVNWLNDSKENTFIPPKNLNVERIVIDSSQGSLIIIFSCIVIPLSLFITGFAVWLRRRNK